MMSTEIVLSQRQVALARQQGSDISAAVQKFLGRQFGTKNRLGIVTSMPRIVKTVVWPGFYTVMQVDPMSLGHTSISVLTGTDTLERLSMIVGASVTSTRRLPLQDGRYLRGMFYVAVDPRVEQATERAKAQLAAPARPEVKLPRSVELDMSKRPAGNYMLPAGVSARGDEWVSFEKVPHLLIAGETGGGKSNFLHSLLVALLTTEEPDDLKVAFVSPKRSEFAMWADAPHCLMKRVSVTVKEATEVVDLFLAEFERRDLAFTQNGVRNIDAYHALGRGRYPRWLLVADEMLDIALDAGIRSELMTKFARLVSKSRSHGLHVILAATNPKWDVIPTLVTVGIDYRICYRVTTPNLARSMRCAGADTIPDDVPGRAVVRLPGVTGYVQSYFVSDEVILSAAAMLVRGASEGGARVPTTARIAPDEAQLVIYAMERLVGYFQISGTGGNDKPPGLEATFKSAGWSGYRLRMLARQWESLGWLHSQTEAGKGRAGSRKVTPVLEEIARRSVGGSVGESVGDAVTHARSAVGGCG